jgi:hypothetical protein
LVVGDTLPEGEEGDGKFAGHGNDGALLGGLAAAFGDAQSRVPQSGGRAKGPEGEQMGSCLNSQQIWRNLN